MTLPSKASLLGKQCSQLNISTFRCDVEFSVESSNSTSNETKYQVKVSAIQPPTINLTTLQEALFAKLPETAKILLENPEALKLAVLRSGLNITFEDIENSTDAWNIVANLTDLDIIAISDIVNRISTDNNYNTTSITTVNPLDITKPATTTSSTEHAASEAQTPASNEETSAPNADDTTTETAEKQHFKYRTELQFPETMDYSTLVYSAFLHTVSVEYLRS